MRRAEAAPNSVVASPNLQPSTSMEEPTSVLPHVLLGSRAHARDRALLERLRVTHVLNVRSVSGSLAVLRAPTAAANAHRPRVLRR